MSVSIGCMTFIDGKLVRVPDTVSIGNEVIPIPEGSSSIKRHGVEVTVRKSTVLMDEVDKLIKVTNRVDLEREIPIVRAKIKAELELGPDNNLMHMLATLDKLEHPSKFTKIDQMRAVQKKFPVDHPQYQYLENMIRDMERIL